MSDQNLYEVHLTDGQRHTVQTPHHHDNHDDKTWNDHMVDLLKNIAAGVTVNRIEKIIFRGKAR